MYLFSITKQVPSNLLCCPVQTSGSNMTAPAWENLKALPMKKETLMPCQELKLNANSSLGEAEAPHSSSTASSDSH